MRASSSSQKRGAGVPRKVTGAGTTVSIDAIVAWSPSVPMLISALTSKLVQSRRPWSISLADNVISSSGFGDRRAATDTAYSMRSGTHASAAPRLGSVANASYHASHVVAATVTSAWSPVAIFSAGSPVIAAVPPTRSVDASRLPSSARPTIVCSQRVVAGSFASGSGAGCGCIAKRVMNAAR